MSLGVLWVVPGGPLGVLEGLSGSPWRSLGGPEVSQNGFWKVVKNMKKQIVCCSVLKHRGPRAILRGGPGSSWETLGFIKNQDFEDFAAVAKCRNQYNS